MRKLVLTAALISQVGFAADYPLSGKLPALTLTSQKSADALQDCIGLALQPVGKPHAIRDGNQRIVTIGPEKLPGIVVTITDAEPRLIEARARLILNHKWRERIRFCAA